MATAEPRPEALFTVPATQPFLTALARAILAGDLPRTGGAAPASFGLPSYTILLPTRRAARALQTAFLSLSGNNALLLPRIAALGAPDEDEYLLGGMAEPELPGAEPLALPPAISAIERQLALTRLVLVWQAQRATNLGDDVPDELRGAALVPTPGQAYALAGELARLLDFAEAEGANLADLARLAPEPFAAHWQLTLDFLGILTTYWQKHLDERGLMSPVARRNALTDAWAARLLTHPPAGPIIAAGSTGSVPATARLLAAIARLPNGAVVLPGLDLDLDDASWDALVGHPEHPQYGMAQLLGAMGIARRDVSILAGAEPSAAKAARIGALSEALRPASTTERWADFPAARDGDALRAAFSGVSLIAAPTAQDEAEVIALILREALETAGQTAALVTPDRALARRVAARLKRWGLAIDDSAGRPADKTPPGAFLDHVLEAASRGFDALSLAALLKHPLTRLGLSRTALLAAARALELLALRQPLTVQGVAALRAALATARDASARRNLHRNGRHLAARGSLDAAGLLLVRLEDGFAPLTAVLADPDPRPLKDFVAAHIETAESMARSETCAAVELWRGEAGEALALHLAELLSAHDSGLRIRASDYPSLYRSLVSGVTVRPRAAQHPRLAIWGPLEARLQQPDVLVLGGLNEGVWPRVEDAGPWLNRPMRAELGLPAPERRIGLSAHDFAEGASATRVTLTRAEKADGAPTVPSRWLLRLGALLEGAGATDALAPDRPWLPWARARDDAPRIAPQSVPAPCPPVEARPVRMSVSDVQRWMANPYAIFARNILKLDPMPGLGEMQEASKRGEIVHGILNRFAADHPVTLPDDIEAALMGHADALFAELGAHPAARAFWLPQFKRFAAWFAETEPERRSSVARVLAEVDGAIDIDTPRGFKLTARADRIDLHTDGTVAIYDYKTGSVPSDSAVETLFAPQLPLEAAIAAEGGFAGLSPCRPFSVRYIRATGRGDGGEERDAGKSDASALAARALKDLTALVLEFENPATPYRALRRPVAHLKSAYDYDDYEHLARLFADDEEESIP